MTNTHHSPLTTHRHRRGLTLVELLLTLAVLAMLVAISWPVLGSARRAAQRTSCAGNLRQIGAAYQMYVDDYGRYPNGLQLMRSGAIRDRRVYYCPEDFSMLLEGAASSYRYAFRVPPEMVPIWQLPSVHPSIVLATCEHHVGPRQEVLAGDATRPIPPRHPYHLVVRAAGNVEPVHVDRVRRFYVPGSQISFRPTYPGEPGYEEAVKEAP